MVGYGLDYGEVYRNLRFVGVLKPEVYGAGGPEADSMAIHRRPLGSGRTLAAIAGAVIIVGLRAALVASSVATRPGCPR